jgi:uncharacterized membrane protein YfcA
VGSGTLVTFPVLLWVGYSPVTANVSNNVGLLGGGLTGVIGYRRELEGQKQRARRFGAASLLGGITGAVLLLQLPAEAFEAIVPFFIGIALIMIVLQPRLQRIVAARHGHGRAHEGPFTRLGVYLAGVYGGYFGAAQGVLLMAILGLAIPDEDIQRLNGLKNVLATIVNLVAAVLFVIIADIAWQPAALIGVGSLIGGQLGSRYGRRLPAVWLRALIIVVGVAAIVRLLTS